MWVQILGLLAAIGLIWWLWAYVRHNPQAFSLQNVNKSFFSMGVLAIILIVFVAALVFFLKH